VTYLVERLVELRRHLDHLRAIRPQVTGREIPEPVERFAELVRRLLDEADRG
jgi:hypothetical protein